MVLFKDRNSYGREEQTNDNIAVLIFVNYPEPKVWLDQSFIKDSSKLLNTHYIQWIVQILTDHSDISAGISTKGIWLHNRCVDATYRSL